MVKPTSYLQPLPVQILYFLEIFLREIFLTKPFIFISHLGLLHIQKDVTKNVTYNVPKDDRRTP